jgi:hypothetical protein
MMFVDRTLAGLKMFEYTHINIQKNVFINGRFSVGDMNFDWKSETNGDHVTKLPFHRHKCRFDYS